MAQRYEIQQWVNSTAWDDPLLAEQVVDDIAELRSDDERAWVAIVARHDVERVQRKLREADSARAAAIEERAHLLRNLHHDQGITMYRLAQWCGVSHQAMRRIIKGGSHDRD